MCRTNKIAGQETENVSDKMIGCLCWFNNYRETVVGILKEIQTPPSGEAHYLDDNGYFYPICRPVKPEEVKFYNHIGDVNEKVDHCNDGICERNKGKIRGDCYNCPFREE